MKLTKASEHGIFAARVLLGWLFFYAGITKILDPNWSAAGYLTNAQGLPGLFAWFAQPANLPWVNFLNEWGLTLIGAALILGLFSRLASYAGILLMALYYLPGLNFPMVEHGFLVDEHIIYIAVLVIMIELNAGKLWGLDKYLGKKFKKVWWL